MSASASKWLIAVIVMCCVALSNSATAATLNFAETPVQAAANSMAMTTWASAMRAPLAHIAAPGGGAIDATLTATIANFEGNDGVLGNADDNFVLAGGAAAAGVFDVLRYRAVMRSHVSGGADLTVAWRDGAFAATYPANRRWLQVITTNKPGAAGAADNRGIVAMSQTYIDFGIGQAPIEPFYFHTADPMAGLLLGNNTNRNNEGPDGIPGNADDVAPAMGSPAIDFLFGDSPSRSAWGIGPGRRVTRMHASWRARLYMVDWDGNAPTAMMPSTITVRDGISWGFDLWPKAHRALLRRLDAAGIRVDRSTATVPDPQLFYDGNDTLLFSQIEPEFFDLSGGTTTVDNLNGAQILIEPMSLAPLPEIDPSIYSDRDGDGGFFESDPLDMIVDDQWYFTDSAITIDHPSFGPVLTATLSDVFLFDLRPEFPSGMFDSELQATLTNVTIDNSVANSQYLTELQAFIDGGGVPYMSFESDILTVSNDLQLSLASAGSSIGNFGIFGAVPEPSSLILLVGLISMLAFGPRYRRG